MSDELVEKVIALVDERLSAGYLDIEDFVPHVVALVRAETLEEAAGEAMKPCPVSPHPRECEECRGSRLAYRWPGEIAAAIRALGKP